jgi:hypothetical protein
MQSFNVAIKRSYWQLIWLLLLHAIAIGLAVSFPVFLLWKLTLILVIIAGLGYQLYRWFYPPWQYLYYRQNQWWVNRQGELLPIIIQARSVVCSYLISLQFKSDQSKHRGSILLLAWDYPAAEYRQLARTLRINKT